jgi:hypothetical protein
MRKHCSNVCKLRPCGTHAYHRDRSTATAIFANGTYFLDNLRIYTAILNSNNFHSIITEKLQKYKDLTEELFGI